MARQAGGRERGPGLTQELPLDRRRLRAALAATYPWVDDPEVGPSSVEAGECDRCGGRPRLLGTCGPVAWRALCRDCSLEVGEDGWCDGHAEDGHRYRTWAGRLPTEWATVTRLWWVATGEVRADPAWLAVARAEVSEPVRAALP